MKKMPIQRLEKLLEVLQKHGVTHYEGDGLKLALVFNPPVPKQVNVPEMPTAQQADLPLSMSMWGGEYRG